MKTILRKISIISLLAICLSSCNFNSNDSFSSTDDSTDNSSTIGTLALLYGDGVPNESIGNDNDLYLNLLTWDIYIKTNGSWIINSESVIDVNSICRQDLIAVYEIYTQKYAGYTWGFDLWVSDLVNKKLKSTISFETFGGNVINPIQCFKGQEIAITITAEIENGTFYGWFFDSNLTNEMDSSFILENDITLYAKYNMDEEIQPSATPFINRNGYWVINGNVTSYSGSRALSLDSSGYWAVGGIKTEYLAYTTLNEPIKSVSHSTELNSDVFEMSDGSIKRSPILNTAFTSLNLSCSSVTVQSSINSMPDLVITFEDGVNTWHQSLDYYRITNIENINFSIAGTYSLNIYYCNNIYSLNIDVVEETCTISGSMVFDFHSAMQKQFLDSDLYDIENYCNGSSELSKPVPYTLNISKDINEGTNIKIIELNSNYFEYELDFENNCIYLYNFEILKDYSFYCFVDGLITNKLSISIKSRTCRNLNIDGITNCRDIGGKTNLNGKYIEQGLFFRTAALNKAYTSSLEMIATEKGLSTLSNHLKIKSEVDLRLNEGERGYYVSSAIIGASYMPYIISPGNNMPTIEGNEDAIKYLFNNALSNANNYPMILHCSIGTDRTGLISYLLLGALQCDDKTILKDYLFSNFGLTNAERKMSTLGVSFANYLSTFDGNTISEKTINYLLSIGVNSESLQNITDIFIK